MIVHTETGSRYAVREDGLRRLHMGEESAPLRKDDMDLTVLAWVVRPQVGKPMVALLVGVSDDPLVATVRSTSPVTRIEES